MKYFEYITSSLAKGTLGGNISVGIFAFIGVCAALGIYYGAIRGFSKSVIRLFTVGASAVCSLLCVNAITGLIVKTAVGADGEIETVYALFEKYFSAYMGAMPNLFKPILKEISAETATVFAMMLISVLITPILFILFFYLIRFLSIFVYELLAGLTGAISYGKGVVSTLLGAAVGLCQGVLVAAVILLPVSGMCDVVMSAKEPLLDSRETPNQYIVQVYDVLDDVADNPVFELVDKFGGNAVYDSMISVKIKDTEYNMGEECVDAIKIVSDMFSIVSEGFNWEHPTDNQRELLQITVNDIGDDELIASLVADISRGVAACVRGNVIDTGLEGSPKKLLNDAMYIFTLSNKDTVKEDLQLFLDIYFIMCDRDLISAFVSGESERIRDVLTNKDENGVSSIEIILERLEEHDRASYIVTSFTKLSISNIMGSAGLGEESEQLYENVKEGISTALNHNKSDFETEEEYKQAVYDDLDKTLAENDIVIEEEVKQNMVDYIAENYGDHVGEITDKEINDAILSYYKSYADHKETLNGTEGGETEPSPEGGEADPEGEPIPEN